MEYINLQQRVSRMIAEAFLTCNTNYLGQAFKNTVRGYVFGVPPGFHGQDIAYTFFTEADQNVLNISVAEDLQTYLTQFIRKGDPNSLSLPHIPPYNHNAAVLYLNTTEYRVIMLDAANNRCTWWQTALGINK